MRRLILFTFIFYAYANTAGHAHKADDTVTGFVNAFIAGLNESGRKKAQFAFDSKERFNFFWTPGRRKGVGLGELSSEQKDALRHVFQLVLSKGGQNKVDAIIAAEAALGVIERAPDYRDPKKYYFSLFGKAAENNKWGLRFEGHHLSINMTFTGDDIISASPLFLGSNPETIPDGPDKGLRPLKQEIDLAFKALEALTPEQKKRARGGGEWFGGFLTSPGERRADLGKPAGVKLSELSGDAKSRIRQLVRAYIGTFAPAFADAYMQDVYEKDLPNLRFYWSGGEAYGKSYYYRIAGKRVLIEHDAMAGGTHIHSAWRDAIHDFGE